ncbi:unnamed protein product [Prorocentrum cordatum]|uniref:Probable beta-glucosidase G n=1 Tax=Prorocentrum cordatum TaxID=2364126 RepID=A0ABN9QSE0_9DINO|nr:unnamed protein product [Polarella glacialis]
MPLALNDGPQGYNHYQEALAGTSTQFPCLLAVAASFDPTVSEKYAGAIADEFVTKGANVLLGPDIEVARVPLTGRSFETLTGEEPFLGASLVGPYVKAVQDRGIIVTIKHWLDNNEEIFRMTMNVDVDARTQHEIYMPVFKAAIEAGASAVMCSYQKVDGTHACENKQLLKTLLREDLGFRGFIMSDWGATHDAKRSADAGLDMEMPGGDDDEFQKLEKLVTDGDLSEETIDEMAGNVLRSMYAVGHFDGKFHYTSADASLDLDTTSDKNRDLARQTIVDSAVLLKNEDSVLPFDASSLSSVVLVGKYCDQVTDDSYGQGSTYAGGGSGYVMSNRTVSIYKGLTDKLKSATVTKSKDAAGAKGVDVAVVCLAAHSEEGWDRESIEMPEADLVGQLRKQDPEQTIVVIGITPGAVTTPWVEDADAALLLFMPGEQVGPAVADLLLGVASPGGRLPVSMPRADEQRFVPAQYPGEPYNDVNMTAKFSEGVLVGYRWNVAKGVPSAFAFGFGLSYTEFQYGTPAVQPSGKGVTVTLQVSNVGKHDGSDVTQVYVGFPSLKPALFQLRGFQKVQVPAGGSETVTMVLGPEAWSFYDQAKSKWVCAADLGEEVTISLGRSAADLFWSATLADGKVAVTAAPSAQPSAAPEAAAASPQAAADPAAAQPSAASEAAAASPQAAADPAAPVV